MTVRAYVGRRLTLTVALALLLGAVGSVPAAQLGTHYVVTVSGMHCSGCARVVREALTKLPEVASVDTDFKAQTATITTKPGEALTRALVEEALRRDGYEITSFIEVAPTQ